MTGSTSFPSGQKLPVSSQESMISLHRVDKPVGREEVMKRLSKELTSRPLPKPPGHPSTQARQSEGKILSARTKELSPDSARSTATAVKSVCLKLFHAAKAASEMPIKISGTGLQTTIKLQTKEEALQERTQNELLQSHAKKEFQKLQNQHDSKERIKMFNEFKQQAWFPEIGAKLKGWKDEEAFVNQLKENHLLPAAKKELNSIREDIERYRKNPSIDGAKTAIDRFNAFSKDRNNQTFADLNKLDGWNYITRSIEDIKKSYRLA
jgi:hypothetical protein